MSLAGQVTGAKEVWRSSWRKRHLIWESMMEGGDERKQERPERASMGERIESRTWFERQRSYTVSPALEGESLFLLPLSLISCYPLSLSSPSPWMILLKLCYLQYLSPIRHRFQIKMTEKNKNDWKIKKWLNVCSKSFWDFCKRYNNNSNMYYYEPIYHKTMSMTNKKIISTWTQTW